MKVVITGGHFSPALAVIEELILRKNEVLVVGRKHALEADAGLSYEYVVCKQRNIPFVELGAGRLQRKFSRHTVSSLLRIPISILKARTILKDYKPDAVLVFGGYLALPVAISAKLLNIPVFVHEQTTRASFANRQIAKFAASIFISFESSRAFFPKEKTILTGNPIRPEIFEVKKSIALPQAKHLVYITGGSTGSHFINMLIKNNLEQMFDKLPDIAIIHQVGDSKKFSDYEQLNRVWDSLNDKLKKRYILRKFIMPDEMGWIYKNSDLIISRSGINSVCEYIALGKLALLIPLPYGQKGEQLENAKYYKSVNSAGAYIEQNQCSGENFLKTISVLYSKTHGSVKSSAQKELGPSAGKTIVDKIQFFHEKKKISKE